MLAAILIILIAWAILAVFAGMVLLPIKWAFYTIRAAFRFVRWATTNR